MSRPLFYISGSWINLNTLSYILPEHHLKGNSLTLGTYNKAVELLKILSHNLVQFKSHWLLAQVQDTSHTERYFFEHIYHIVLLVEIFTLF